LQIHLPRAVWGIHLRRDGETDLAITDYKRAVVLGPSHINAYWVLSTLYYALERYDEALASYRAYLAITGENADSEVLQRVEELEARDE
jgi:tetratricopeptide (TPR) repeat protein